MLSRILLFSLEAVVATPQVFAQQMEDSVHSGEVEIGTLFGTSHGDDEITTMEMPSAFGGEKSSIAPLTALYLSWFPGDYMAVGPEINFGRTSLDEGKSPEAVTNLSLGCRASFFSRPSSLRGLLPGTERPFLEEWWRA